MFCKVWEKNLNNHNKKGKLPQELEVRNEQDFQEITNRIWAAIEKIRSNQKFKPSQMILAKLASVSRGTLINRQWPLDELKKIKEIRSQIILEKKASKEVNINDHTEISLEKRLYLSREELRVWKFKADESRNRISELELLIKSQNEEKELLIKEVKRLSETIAKRRIVKI